MESVMGGGREGGVGTEVQDHSALVLRDLEEKRVNKRRRARGIHGEMPSHTQKEIPKGERKYDTNMDAEEDEGEGDEEHHHEKIESRIGGDDEDARRAH